MTWTFALATCAVGLLASCANPEIVDHSFGFDTRRDGQNAAIVDYRYGQSKLPVSMPEGAVEQGKTVTFNSVTGPMLRPDFLYVKWRMNDTGQVYEDKVDLRKRLPENIKDHEVYFMVKGPQLYVYLISPDRRSTETPPIGPSTYSHLRTVQLYPDLPKD